MRPIHVLFLTDDPAVKEFFAELAPETCLAKLLGSAAEAQEAIRAIPHPIVVLDYDLKGKNGIEVYKLLRTGNPDLKVIMLSAANDVPLAVAAAKQGINEVLRKPLRQEDFLKVLEDLVESFGGQAFCLPDEPGFEWLLGSSPALDHCLAEAEKGLKNGRDIILVSEPGIDCHSFARILHQNGRLPRRKLVNLDLQAFQKEVDESHFWTMLQKILMLKENAFDLEEDLCGTLLLTNFGRLEYHFQHSLLDFLKNKSRRIGAEKLDRKIRIVIAVTGRVGLEAFEKEELLSAFNLLVLPPLRNRKNDLPVIFNAYLDKYNRWFSRQVNLVSTDALNFLFYLDFSGNYCQLESLAAAAVLRGTSGRLGINELPICASQLQNAALNRLLAKRNFNLTHAQRDYEVGLFNTVLAKTNFNLDATARFLSVSKLFLQGRMG